MSALISLLKRLAAAVGNLAQRMSASPGDKTEQPTSRPLTLTHGYQSVFYVFLVALAFLFRDNPYLVYPQILYLLVILLALNLAAGRALKIERFGKRLSAVIILANCGTIAAILSYSGEQASNLWVLFLLPIYTACVLLEGREVVLVTVGAVACNVIYYVFSTVYWSSVTYFEISVKSAILSFAAVTTWKVVQQERRSQQMLERSSAELERSEHYLQLFRRLVGQIDDAILVINPTTGHLVDINGTWSRNLGYPREEFKGISLGDLPGFLPGGMSWKNFADQVREKKSMRFESEPHRSDHKPCPMEFNVQWVSQEGQDYLIAVARDVTERRRSEAQLRQAQKMEAVGRLAGGVAHDFNNMLSVIIGVTDMLLENTRKNNALHDDLEQISQAAERSAALTRQLLAFSRQQMVQPRIMDLNAAVKDTARMLERLIGEHIRFYAVLGPEIGRIRIDPGQLQQVLLNLAVNARDAMPRGGTLTIKTADAHLREGLADARDPVPAGAYVMLEMEDTGTGMNEEAQAHLFEPFFTTKEVGKGTGLGLSVIHSVVKQNGGYIHVRSAPGKGTAFTIYFPRAEGAPAEGRAEEAKKGPPRKATILLVEDEIAVRNVAQRILAREGYHVITAQDGQEALRAARDHRGKIHLLLTDVVMPGMSGPELFGSLLTALPDLRTIFMSGHVGSSAIDQIVANSKAAFLQKPISPNALTQKVREVLET